jgi:MFS family permease
MIFGIGLGTIGMGILAISMESWVFIAGIMIFSIGEMTAHPKFISYVGLIAPPDKKALYLGYSFLYGVIGSGVGGILGATLYVKFVDGMNRPDLLWMIFTGIGVVAIISMLLYNRFLAPKR